MPNLRHISATDVPTSFCFKANAICSSMYLLFFIACLLFEVENHARISTFKCSFLSGEGQP